MQTTTRRPNVDTPARWQAALARAHAQGVAVRQIQCGAWVATSGIDAEAAYLVTSHGCECAAAVAGDPVCKHRAALREVLGTLEPEAPAADPDAAMTPAEWAAFWDGLYAAYPAIAPGPVASLTDADIADLPQSLWAPVTSMSDLDIELRDGACPACGGNGYHVRASQTFTGTTFRTNCRSCRGTGLAPVEPRRLIAA